ncbi:MAG: WYL domain-containing protein [Porphyromonas sp.]|nr:WYL domain-containing protein [Porphyromonas sp.]
MPINQTNKLAWVVETILNSGKISFEELNQKWMEATDFSGGEELLKRTFHKWRYNILDTFGLEIVCEKGGEYRYYIGNAEDLKDGGIGMWLLETFTVSNSLITSKSIKNRIILESVPSGLKYLDQIIQAMKENRMIHITYNSYWSGDSRPHYLIPLCVKLFRQRWYLVGKVWANGHTAVFSLDRIKDFRKSSHEFEYPKDFDPHSFFNGFYGVFVDQEQKVANVELKVTASQANYLRDLPIHSSQIEKESNDEFSIFRIEVCPTYDFQQEILKYGDQVEVLEPLWLRHQIADKVQRMHQRYLCKSIK